MTDPATVPPEYYGYVVAFLRDAFPPLSVLLVAAFGVGLGSLVGRSFR